MTTYIALLKGINVGGHHKIKMDDLRSILEEIGLNRVETYIQSGNILFDTAEDESTLRVKIEEAIVKNFGFSVSVVLRTADDIRQIILTCPYSEGEIQSAEAANTEGESMYVAFCSDLVPLEKVELLKAFQSEEETYCCQGKNIYLLLRHSIRNSKLSSQLQVANTSITVRNWKTVKKLNELAENRKYKNKSE